MSRRTEQQNRMTAAAVRRAEPDARPAGRTAIRTKPVRVSLDLDPADYERLTRWAQSAAAPTGRIRVTHADALRALVRALDDAVVTDIAHELLREGIA